ncbi:SDR family NAD(P)-dependent oxidoreductase [Ruania zhangjianzhongii]|uniref:SDR family NAD(P)-dependent oxidoreductase n=1 Tax=Ruania zhangjianzhongii TaxID=2603206 RepID=UPI0011CAC8A3|nr:SDR family oxidoreductase [Ruania zhangjianzhongii]
MSTAAPGTGEFESLVAVVTGGASGIGAQVAQRLHDGGARVAILDRTVAEPGAGTAAGAAEGTWLELRADVSDQTSVSAAVEQVIGAWGRLDVVVNNAGIGAQGTVADGSEEQWHQVLDVNLMGMVRTSRAALPHLRLSPAAAIVNVSSIAATAGLPQRALYSASKGAVLGLTRAMAADHIREGIRVNCVSPGTADTPWVNRLLDSAADPEAERAALQSRQPHGRLVDPAEVAEAVAYLASPRNGSTTGVTLAIDGGMDALRLRPA